VTAGRKEKVGGNCILRVFMASPHAKYYQRDQIIEAGMEVMWHITSVG
jgi:hypothetical protein